MALPANFREYVEEDWETLSDLTDEFAEVLTYRYKSDSSTESFKGYPEEQDDAIDPFATVKFRFRVAQITLGITLGDQIIRDGKRHTILKAQEDGHGFATVTCKTPEAVS